MKTRLIESSVFEEIQKRSFDHVKTELQEAASKLSKVSGSKLNLKLVNEDYAVYNSVKNPNIMLKTKYQFTDNDTIKFNEFEKIVLDEASCRRNKKKACAKMIEALANEDKVEAETQWKEYKKLLNITEMVKKKAQKPGNAPGDAGCCNPDEEDNEAQGKKRTAQKDNLGKYGSLTTSTGELGPEKGLKAVDPALEEWLTRLPNYKEVIKQVVEAAKEVAEVVCNEQTGGLKVKMKKASAIEDDEEEDQEDPEHEAEESEEEEEEERATGEEDEDEEAEEKPIKKSKKSDEPEVDEIEVPTKGKEDKVKDDGLKSKLFRGKLAKARKAMAECETNKVFASSIVDLKRATNSRDEDQISEIVTNIVSKNPNLIYVSKNELTEMVGRILKRAGEKNWDANLSEDIAGGLRQLSHSIYSEAAYEILKFAANDEVVGLEEELSDDKYEAFEQVSERYFNNIYEKAEKQYHALNNLSEMLAKAAITLESDAKVYGIDDKRVKKLIAEYRQFSSQIAANAIGSINEGVVTAVVGSLLTKMANDYSLNDKAGFVDPGHFRKNWDMDDNDYKKWATGGNKETKTGDEEISLSNPASPKSKPDTELDLLDKDARTIKDFNVMRQGIHTNPLAPKAMGSDSLDLS